MKKNCNLILIIGFIIFGCTEKRTYFNGEISYFEAFLQTDSLIGLPIEFNDIYTGDMYVYDSIMCFLSNKHSDFYFPIFSLQTKKHLLDVCAKGSGPAEFLDLTGFQQYEFQNDQIKIWLREIMSEKFFLLNLTQSLQERKTVVDSIIPLKWTNSRYFPPNSFSFILNDGKVIIKNQSYKENEESAEYIPPTYCLYDVETKHKIKDIILYHEPLINNQDKNIWFGAYLHSLDRLKPDKTKIAMAMEMLCQINILDISSGNLKGYRLKNTPDFKDLETVAKNSTGYYIDISVDDEYIYAFYSGKNPSDHFKFYISNEVHVFDWNGNPVKKFILSDEGDYLRLDPVQKKLYVKNDAEEVFCYDVQYLYEIE